MFTACVAPNARAVARRAPSPERPATISGCAPESAAIRAHSRPIGPGPSTTTESPGRMVGVPAHRVVGDRVRLGQAGQLERQRVGHVVQAARGHFHELGHRAVDAVAEALARRAQVVAAGAAHQARAADHGGGFADHAVAFAEVLNVVTGRGHGAAELVAERDRNVHRPRVRAVRLVHVGAADRHRADGEQHVGGSDLGHRDFPQLHRHRRERVLHDGLLCLHRAPQLFGRLNGVLRISPQISLRTE